MRENKAGNDKKNSRVSRRTGTVKLINDMSHPVENLVSANQHAA